MNSITKDRSTFTLKNSREEIATVKYNSQNNSIRISSSERRLFFLTSGGNLLQHKILLATEYGVPIGEDYPIKKHQKGVMHIGENKFIYRLDNNILELSDKRKKPLIRFSFNDSAALDSYEASGVIFAVAWLFMNSELSEATARKASALYVS